MSRKQLIFKQPFVSELERRVKASSDEENKEAYYERSTCAYSEFDTMPSLIEVADEKPELLPGKDKDFTNAIKIYDYLNIKDETQASDRRLWTYLSHVDFRDYVKERWGLSEKNNVQNKILARWFHTRLSDSRSLERHAIARLWWAIHLTRDPYGDDNEYYSELSNKINAYCYSEVLFANQDILQSLLERNLGHSKKILIATLEYIKQHPEFQPKKAVQQLTVQINLRMGYRKIDTLSFPELLRLIDEAAKDITDDVAVNNEEDIE